MPSLFEIPITPSTAQKFAVTLNTVTYNFQLRWCDPSQCWILDISDIADTPIVLGIPLVTGTDLLEQYAYLGFVGGLFVYTDFSPDTVPDFNSLGVNGHLYYAQ